MFGMPALRESLRERLITAGLAASLLFGFWLVAHVVSFTSRTPIVRTLPVESGFESVTTTTSEASNPSSPQPKMPAVSRTRIRLPEAGPTQSPRRQIVPRETAAPRIQLGVAAADFSTRRMPSKTSAAVQVASRHRRMEPGLALERAQPARDTNDTAPVFRIRLPSIEERPRAGAAVPRAREIPVPPLTQENVNVDEIIEWMRRNASGIPPGIQRHVEYRPGNLTVATSLAHTGEEWEVYLLARVPVRELHVVLVQGDETYYLIDRNFQREGRSFRVGYARRDGHMITGVVSEERAASSTEAVRFYEVFLSWWDRKRREL